ncbi:MAG: 3-oxoacyl-[acyl-carrier-protein] synthase II [Verrucomicrobiales bacterium]
MIRVVVTGLGPVTPIGIGKEAFWQGILAERSAIDYLRAFDASPFHAKASAEMRDFQPEAYFPPHRLKRLDRFAQLALLSARFAIADAGLECSSAEPRPRFGVSFGSALGGFSFAEEQHAIFLEHGPKAIARPLAFRIFGGAAHANIAMEYGLQGPGTGNSNSCASGNTAIGDAFRFIREGVADVMIAGAAEAPLSPLTFAAFDNINTMSRRDVDPIARAYCPFERRRDGFVMGEGAAALVLESWEHAQARGADIYGEVIAFSLTNEAHHMTSPDPSGEPLRRTIQLALDQARLEPNQIDYINAHASATQMNDINEAQCVAQLFGRNGNTPPPLSGTKAYTGHALGAAGAIEAAATLLAMRESHLIPTLHLEEIDPSLPPLDYVPNTGRDGVTIRHALNLSLGFGGINSCLALGKT